MGARLENEQVTRRHSADQSELERCVEERTAELVDANARLTREIAERRRAEQIQVAIYRISEAAQASHNLDQLFGQIHAIIGELMPARNFYITLYDAETDMIRFPYFSDEIDATPPPRKLRRGLTEYVLRTGEPLLAVQKTYEELERSGQVELIGSPSVDWLGVPLKTQRGVTIGVMAVQTYAESVRLGEPDRDVLVFVSNQVAMVIERKKAEEALQQERQLFMSGPMVAFQWKAAIGWPVEYVSPNVTAELGYAREDLTSGRILYASIVHPDDLSRVAEEVRTYSEAKVPCFEQEYRLAHADGEYRWVYDFTVVVRDPDGAIVHFFGYVMDTTDYKRVEEALLESQQRMHSILQGSPIPSFVIDKDHKVIHWNRALEGLSNIKSEEVINKRQHWRAFYRQERPCMADLLVDNQIAEIPVWYQGKSQKSILLPEAFEATDFFPDLGHEGKWLRFTAAVIRDSSGNLVGAIETLEDVTSTKTITEALQRSEERFRSLFDGVPVGLYRTSPDGRILDANLALCKLLGYSDRASLLESNIIQFYMNSEVRSQFMALMERDGLVRNFEAQFRRKDGAVISVRSDSQAILDDEGKLRFLEGSLQDITESRKLEQQLLQTQKMESIGTLASGVAHDFNNILTVITGCGSMMQLKMESSSPLNLYLKQILEATRRATTLTKSLLAFSRKQAINLEHLNLNAVVSGMISFLQRVLGEDIRMTIQLSSIDLNILADRNQIEVVLMNITTNARDAMPAGGDLGVTTTLAQINPVMSEAHNVPSGKYAVISISDTGQGMDDSVKLRIFDPFFTTKEVTKGTGLGLSTVYGIIKQHNGFIDVYSELGKGTKFKIFLPITDQKPSERAADEQKVLVGGSETLLLVEDDSLVREICVKILTEFGYKVILAENGEEAVSKFKEKGDHIDLIIMDIIMPKKNGQQAFLEIQQIRKDAKVIFISGYPSDIIIQRDLLKEGQNYISKPIMTGELLRLVRTIIDAN